MDKEFLHDSVVRCGKFSPCHDNMTIAMPAQQESGKRRRRQGQKLSAGIGATARGNIADL
ncbi:hypothetical protein AXW83_03375 [Bosea sp. PAMC 26642]|nr:hypothetical protein AXW83_03375 [Bosea sp. PAMC 26642]